MHKSNTDRKKSICEYAHIHSHSHTHTVYTYIHAYRAIFLIFHIFSSENACIHSVKIPCKVYCHIPIHIAKLAAIIPIITATLHRVWQRQARKVQGCHEHHENQEIPQRVVHPSIEPDAALPRPIPATGTHVSHCTRIHIRRVLRTLSSSHSLCVSPRLSPSLTFRVETFFSKLHCE